MAVPGLDAIFFRIPIGATGSRLYHQQTTFTESVTEKNKLRWIRSVSPDEGCKLSTSVENVPHIRQQSRRFATARWSLVVQARECTSQTSRLALEELCSAYWLPIYAFFRHQSGDYHEAQDLTQGFFASLLQHDFTAQLTVSRTISCVPDRCGETLSVQRTHSSKRVKTRRRHGDSVTELVGRQRV